MDLSRLQCNLSFSTSRGFYASKVYESARI